MFRSVWRDCDIDRPFTVHVATFTHSSAARDYWSVSTLRAVAAAWAV